MTLRAGIMARAVPPEMGRRFLALFAGVVALGVVGYGVWSWVYALSNVWTDDAYVEGTIAPVSSKIAGHVAEVLVEDHQSVQAGQVLVRIDPRDWQVRVTQARAAVAVAQAAVTAARSEVPLAREVTRAQGEEAGAALEAARVAARSAESAVEEARARLAARQAAAAAARAEVTGAESAARQAEREMERQRRLVREGLVAQRDFDLAETAAATAAAALEAARRRLAQAEREAEQAQAEVASRRLAVGQAGERVAEAQATLARAKGQRHQVPVKEAEVGRAEAQFRQAQADLAFAELQLGHTEVRAPVAGVVSKKSVEVGQVVQMGQPLLALVPLSEVWVQANFKETQLERIRPGMPAEVRVDTYPGAVLRGTVESISAGTGARFSLLPPENATGNWVKVVQRIPVKVRLDPDGHNPRTLRAGMSAVVTIRVR